MIRPNSIEMVNKKAREIMGYKLSAKKVLFNRAELGCVLLSVLVGLASASAGAATTMSTSSYEYDSTTGLKTADVREPDNPQLHLRTQYTLNAYGNPVKTEVSSMATGTAAIAPRSGTIAYDTTGVFPKSYTNALGQVVTKQFSISSLPLSVNDLNGLSTQWQYDALGRPTREARPDGVITTWTYKMCACQLPTVVHSRQTRKTGAPDVTDYFDALDRVVRTVTTGFDGVTLIYQDTEYDALGRVSRVSRPYYAQATILWTTYVYDALGRRIVSTEPDGSQTKTEYNGLVITVTNPLGQTQTTTRNSVGQVVRVVDTQSNVLSYQYDPNGNLIRTTDPKGNIVAMSYDGLGRLISMDDPDLGARTYSYNALGGLVKQTDAKGNVTTTTYDLLGRAIQRDEPDLKTSLVYDGCTMGKGQLCKVSTDNGYSRLLAYDSLARKIKESTTIDVTYTSSWTFDTAGRIETQTYPNGLVTKYVYTTLGYLSEVRNNSNNALYWQAKVRDAAGRLTQQTYGNGVTTQQIFDIATGRLSNIFAGAGNSVQNLSFSYDRRGNMLTRTDGNQNLSESFLYDSLNRLTSNTVNSSGAGLVAQSYGYDSIGNITSRSDMGSYTYGAGAGPHAVTQIALPAGGTRQYIYDENGNLTQEVQRDAGNNVIASKGRTESYTSFNMPVQLASPSASLTFVYGPEHQRIKQIAPGATTIYMHPDNEGGLGYEKDIKADGTIEHKNFITASGNVVALVKQVGTSNAVTSTLYFHRDNLGSSTAMTNEAGMVVERFAYEPFGKRRTPAGALDPNGAIVGATTDRGFTNHEYLDELDLIHMNGRVYDPALGRFLSADPGVPYPTNTQSYNRYSYTRNNPLIAIDPSGFADLVDTEMQTVYVTGYRPMPVIAPVAVPQGGAVWIYGGAIWIARPSPILTNSKFWQPGTVANTVYLWMLAYANALDNLLKPTKAAETAPPTEGTNSGTSTSDPKAPPQPGEIPTLDWNDPTKPPIGPNGEEWVWRGKPPQGGDKGGYVNPSNPDQSAHPDLAHPAPVGPHWDYTDRNKDNPGWRVYPGGKIDKK